MNKLTAFATRRMNNISCYADVSFLLRHVQRMDAIQLDYMLEQARMYNHDEMIKKIEGEYRRRGTFNYRDAEKAFWS